MKNELLGKLPPFKNKNVLIKDNQQTNDIIKELLKGHEIYAADYDKISDRFWKGSVIKSCRYVFNFLKNNVRYKIEPDTRQSIKSPSAIIATGNNGFNDCKHYSSFFGGLIDSWSRKNKAGKQINWCYRFSNYKLFQDQPHHVFVVVKLGGTEYWCDAVLSSFNYQKPYVNKIDKKPKTMALYQISGIGCNDINCNCNDQFDYGTPMISGRAERKAKRQARREKRKSGENCTGRTALKISLSPARQAFLALVKLNFRGFATKLNNTLNSPNKLKLLEKWCGAGGSAKTLKIAISQGIRKKRLGMLGFAIASVIAAAAGIIALLKPFLGERGQEIAEGAETAIESGQQIFENESSGGETTGAINTNYIWGAAALAGIYLLTRKK
jgi:hypothetical protein